MLDGIVAFISEKGIALASGAGIALVLGLATKLLPKIIGNQVSKQLDKLLRLENPEDKELVLAIVKWVEIKLPDHGKGKERFALAAVMITRLIPMLKGSEAKLAMFIEEGVMAMDAAFKSKLENLK